MAEEQASRILTPQDFASEIQKVVNEHMKLAFRQYKELKATYGTPNKAITEFLKSVSPKVTHDLIETLNNWVESQLNVIETNVEKALEGELGEITPFGAWKTEVPTYEDIQKIVNDHMKLAFKHYKELKSLYGTPSKATVDFIKSVSPKSLHNLIETTDRWIQDQVEAFEANVERELEKTTTTEGEKRPGRKR